MQHLIIGIMEKFGYLGVGLLIAIENVFPPIPSEVILLFGGFMTTYANMNVWMVILFATIGAVIGALVLYSVGLLLTPEYLKRLISGKIGRVLHLRPKDIDMATNWFVKKGNWTVFFCRFIPIARSLISIPAGTAKMNIGEFLILTTVGTAIWNTVLVWLGVFAGESWDSIIHYMNTYSTIILMVIGFIVVTLGMGFYNGRLKGGNK